jgi:signal transduction histidine kinase/CheY-like chemotaxis protein
VLLAVMIVGETLERGVSTLAVTQPLIPALFAAHQLAFRWLINRRLQAGTVFPMWVRYANTFLEISAVTTVLVTRAHTFQNPLYILLSPQPWVYFLFIILATLWLDFRLSVFAGILAGLQFFGVALWLVADPSAGLDITPTFASLVPYGPKAFLLAAAGVGGGVVASELRRRIVSAVSAAAEKGRVERADEAKTAFLASMSHEIRTPLNAVLGYAQLLERDISESDRRHYLATLRASGEHLLGVINQVLDLSRIEAGQSDLDLGPFDLAALADDIGRMFELRCGQRGLAWHVHAGPPGRLVLGDERRLRQVLVNLVGNAVRFTATGSVTLRIDEQPDGTHRFEVADTGPGIAADRQARIFEPFRQDEAGVREGGSGLGLAIARAQVRLMGGALTVNSAPGAGSRFSFALPLQPADAATSRRARDVRLAPARLAAGCRVSAIVADDSAESREVLGTALAIAGVDVRRAVNGEQALALIRERAPDILFLDVRMPGLSGPETLSRLEADGLRRGVRVVAVSASALEHERQAILRSGFDVCLTKPLQFDRLYDCLAELLGITYAPPAPVTPTAPLARDVRPPALPEALGRALRAAAEEGNVTDLHAGFEELERLGDAERILAGELRRLSRRYDMPAIVAVLDEMTAVPRA